MSITSKEEGERVLESTLTVASPFLDGIGSYTCTAENVVDTANSTAEVTVFCESLPSIVVNKKLFYAAYVCPLCYTHTHFTTLQLFTLALAQFLVTSIYHPLSVSFTHIVYIFHSHSLPPSPILPFVQPNPSSEVPQWT